MEKLISFIVLNIFPVKVRNHFSFLNLFLREGKFPILLHSSKQFFGGSTAKGAAAHFTKPFFSSLFSIVAVW